MSADATRMAGRFHGTDAWWPHPTAWLRIEPGEIWLTYHGDAAKTEALEARAGRFTLTVARAPGAVFAAGVEYSQSLMAPRYGPYIAGDRGAFWGDEMTWDADEEILTVGPVPETVPSLPIRLMLHFEDRVLESVVATLASGDSYEFTVARAR